jgi:hypothetical protein
MQNLTKPGPNTVLEWIWRLDAKMALAKLGSDWLMDSVGISRSYMKRCWKVQKSK